MGRRTALIVLAVTIVMSVGIIALFVCGLQLKRLDEKLLALTAPSYPFLFGYIFGDDSIFDDY